jgi:hypothetical protein
MSNRVFFATLAIGILLSVCNVATDLTTPNHSTIAATTDVVLCLALFYIAIREVAKHRRRL